ncbi:MAG: glucose-6-phosphate dehydrogenase [Acidisphaera sp.]|nr:glucose-6-phosphate dehydrogenase [Acidisphaera sp.]
MSGETASGETASGEITSGETASGETLGRYEPAPPCTLVIFGAAGDLTKRLITPALYNLTLAGMLPDGFRIIGLDLADLSDAAWRDALADMLREFVAKGRTELARSDMDQAAWSSLAARMQYMRGDFSNPEFYGALASRLAEQENGGGNRLFYLAVADRFFGPIVEQLGAAGLTRQEEDGPWRRVVIEKPFGHDLPSAIALNQRIAKVLTEDQIYRMDHFLGKETVQNIMMLRFGNGAFENLWNRLHVDHVQITAAERVGVERRGKFYDQTGALRDMVPNHVLQLLAVTAMEPPVSFDADAVRAEKAKVLQAVHGLEAGEAALRNTVRGQYGAGDGSVAYREEPDVDTNSVTETYVAAKLMVDNWRWGGVPFYLRTGKHLKLRKTEIVLQFRAPPFALFRDTPTETLASNRLVLHIQPNEGISLHFNAKNPGPAVQASGVRMDFRYGDFFSEAPSTGYETLLYDVMIGDATLFQRADFVEAGWRVVQPVLDAWGATRPADFPNYPSFSQGPAAADALLRRDGRAWRALS